MFKIENDDSYISLQAPIPNHDVIQTTIIVGGVPLMPIDLIDVVNVGMNQDSQDSDPQSANEFDGPNNSNNDG
jgi:hypothetical protein